MAEFFPPIEPYDSGMLDVGDGQRMYWETCGNPTGKPVLFLHGGPGSGSSPGQRRLFNPATYRAVLLDQRGSGRSRPLAGDPAVDLDTNTTHHLIADIELLRVHLEIEQWHVLGFSWGTTLALGYAQAHPERVSALVLGLVTTTSRREVAWLTEGVGRLFPEQWARFTAAVPAPYRSLPLVDAYAEMLNSAEAQVRDHAASEWCAWEDAHISLGPDHAPNPRFDDPAFRYLFARLVTHYWRNGAFLEEDQLLRDAGTLDGIPGVLIHGRYDVSSPLETAWRLSQAWPTSELQVLDDAGHGSQESFPSAVLRALADLNRG
jgi:proline iminopeptidase